MSTGDVFLLVLLASGLSAFTGAIGAAVVTHVLGHFRLKRQIKEIESLSSVIDIPPTIILK